MMRTVDRVTYGVVALFGVFVAFQGQQWGLILDRIPGPGFLPFWTGVLLVLASVWPLIKTFLDKGEPEPQPFSKSDIFTFGVIIGGGVFVAVFSSILGMMVSICIMTAGVSWLMGMRKIPVVAAVAVGMPLVMYLLFDLLLGVPMPKNILGF